MGKTQSCAGKEDESLPSYWLSYKQWSHGHNKCSVDCCLSKWCKCLVRMEGWAFGVSRAEKDLNPPPSHCKALENTWN